MHRAAALQQHTRTTSVADPWRTGIVVAILLVPAPDHFRRNVRFVCIEHERACPALVAFVVRNKYETVALAPAHACETIFSFEQLGRLTGVRRFEHYDTVAMVNLLLRIALVQRFDPDECRWFVRSPTN